MMSTRLLPAMIKSCKECPIIDDAGDNKLGLNNGQMLLGEVASLQDLNHRQLSMKSDITS